MGVAACCTADGGVVGNVGGGGDSLDRGGDEGMSGSDDCELDGRDAWELGTFLKKLSMLAFLLPLFVRPGRRDDIASMPCKPFVECTRLQWLYRHVRMWLCAKSYAGLVTHVNEAGSAW